MGDEKSDDRISYPEHEKLHLVKDKSQAIGEFLDWLGGEKKIMLGETVMFEDYGTGTHFVPWSGDVQALLAEFFGIDRAVLEREKRAMLATIRAAD